MTVKQFFDLVSNRVYMYYHCKDRRFYIITSDNYMCDGFQNLTINKLDFNDSVGVVSVIAWE